MDEKFSAVRKGLLEFAILRIIAGERVYVADMLVKLAETPFATQEGTLYPLLRRLEAQGLLASEWRIENGPPRRYYTLSPEGKELYVELTGNWRSLVDTVERLIGEDQSRRRRAANEPR